MATRARALLSVYDKSGLIEFGAGLIELGFELVASGRHRGARSNQAGLPVTQVDAITGFPEILGGRVETLHPAVHGGILARRTPQHLAELAAHAITPIGLVACNLYPFSQTVSRPNVDEAQAIEEIDIGGVTLLRAAAKNFESVIVVCDPADYGGVLAALRARRLGVRRAPRWATKLPAARARKRRASSRWTSRTPPPRLESLSPHSSLRCSHRAPG